MRYPFHTYIINYIIFHQLWCQWPHRKVDQPNYSVNISMSVYNWSSKKTCQSERWGAFYFVFNLSVLLHLQCVNMCSPINARLLMASLCITELPNDTARQLCTQPSLPSHDWLPCLLLVWPHTMQLVFYPEGILHILHQQPPTVYPDHPLSQAYWWVSVKTETLWKSSQ